MATPPDHYELLVSKLDAFIRKYYLNGAIRGLLYSTGLILFLFLVVSLLEYRFYFGGGTRRFLWYGFLLVSLTAVTAWVGLPLARYFRLGNRIDHDTAAAIIGKHFGNVKDKLLNVLQLRRQADSGGDRALLMASVDQKASEISPVPFRSAIDLTHNRRYLKYALPPLALLLIILFAAPSLIQDSTSRLIRSSETFERPAPFRFTVAEELEVVQYGNFPLTVRVEGDVLPAEAFIEVEGYRYRLERQSPNTFTYQFNNVRSDKAFRLEAGEVSSHDYTLSVLPKPSIAGFTVDVDYPDYLGIDNESLSNIGDLTVPVGTRLRWAFDTENTGSIDLRFASEDTLSTVDRDGSNLYSFRKQAMRNDRYTLLIGNERLPLADSVSYTLAVIPDQYPRIDVETFRDSTDQQLRYFVGDASDDYGIRKLDFVYRVQQEGSEAEETRINISGRNGKQTRYDYVLDLRNDLELQAGDALTYYFEVFDNDGVNGSKSARTAVMTHRMPTREELEARAENNDSKVKDELKKALEATRELQDDTKSLREKMLQEKEVDWKLKKEVEKLAERQQEVQEQIEEAQKAFEENMENEPQKNEEVRKKEEQLQEMFEESLDEEMQELMEEIQKLMEELNKDQTLEKMEEMERSDEEAEAKLDRMLELFKQLEVEKEMQDAIEKLEELAQEQQELAEETEQGETPPEELQQQQEQLQEEFEKVEEKLEQTEQKNEALDRPMPLDTKQEESEEVKQDMQDAQQQLQEQQQQDASQKQQDASKKMKKMAQQMQQNMQSMQMQSNKEDMAAIRQLLENIVDLSFDQEETMDQLNQTTINTPRYVELVQQQFQISNDFALVEDSLQALAKRNFQIETFVTEKVGDIKGNLSTTITELEERRTPQAANQQQRAMTGLNELALMLSESMEQMQQQMAGQMKEQQQAQPKPGQGQKGQQPQPGEQPGSEGQKEIGQDMEGLKEGMKQGQRGSSKEFAEMAARQAALRRALEEKQRQRQESGEGKDGQLEELIEQMNEAEEDLVNKRLTTETLQRQQDILTKMLEHETAERQQKQDEKRKSETASQQPRQLPPDLEEYIRQRRAEVERFQRVTPRLSPYYQRLVDDYFRTLGSD